MCIRDRNESGCFEYSDPNKFNGVFETIGAATTYLDASSNVVLEMDVQAQTTFTYTLPAVWSSGRGSNIGIVSFKNVPANYANATTITLITTQGGAHGGGTGYANTVATNGIGATCTLIPISGGSAVAGIQTRGQVAGGTGAASTVVCSSAANNSDFISFFIHYDGSTNTALTSYKVYVTGNTGFHFGSVGI